VIAQSTSAKTPPGWAGPLEELLRRAGQAQVPVAVVGSVALAVRGVDVCPATLT
jgi:hypothetical protein